MVRFAVIFIAFTGILATYSDDAQAFDYLEHSYLTDRACWQAQIELGALIKERPDDSLLRERYLALAIACPDRSPDQYCVNKRKAVTSNINRVGDRPWENRAYPMTLGDFSALGDHLSRLGPIRGLSGARKPGLTKDMLGWFSKGDTAAGGVVGRVGRKACSNAEDVPWSEIEADVDAVATELFKTGSPQTIPTSLLSPLARSSLNQGPGEQAALYSISNPHYLDLVLRNHNHFGAEAFDSWLGFHSTSAAIADRRCEATFALGLSKTRRLARDLPEFKDINWRSLNETQLAATGCDILAEHARLRLLDWMEGADDELVAPVRGFIEGLADLPEESDERVYTDVRDELNMVVAALTALVFEGSGLHYLQDGFAGGHIRTIRSRGGLGGVRYDHDHDNAEGVSAILRTRAGDFPFVAFGDMYMLGRHNLIPDHCDWERLSRNAESPEQISACLLRHQRGLIVATSAASLIDWAVGGMLFVPVDPYRCARSELETSVCDLLPLTAVSAAGALPPHKSSQTSGLHQGNLPVPPPPFAYESLTTTLAFDVAGSNAQYGLQLTILSELDTLANWMTSYRAAVLASTGVGDRGQVLGEFSYNFHLRWSARVLFEAGAGTYAGFQGIGEGLSFMAGLGPSAGIVALPEGWVKIPLELSVSFRLPMTFYTSTYGFAGESFGIEAFWLQFGLGLAFM